MKTIHKLTLTLLAGVSIGLIAARSIPAQAVKPPPAYVIAEAEPDPTKPADAAASRRYSDEAPKTIAAFGGQFLIRGGKAETVEGDTSNGRIVVIAFDSLEKARGWYFSPAYEAIKPIRQNTTKSRILIVEGVAR
jgi:uncharacterized protein (DUF1330 family)